MKGGVAFYLPEIHVQSVFTYGYETGEQETKRLGTDLVKVHSSGTNG